jgi:hypothetical protein
MNKFPQDSNRKLYFKKDPQNDFVPLKKRRRKEVKENPNLVGNGRFQCLVANERFQCLVVLEGKTSFSPLFTFLLTNFI